MPLAHLWCQKSVPKCLKFLCFLPICSHACPSCMHRCAYMHVHMHGSHPQPPLPPQEIWRPKSYWKPRYDTLCHWMQNFKFSCQSLRWWWGGGVWHQTPPPPPLNFNLTKSKKSSCSLGVVVGGGVWHQTPPPPPPPLNFNLTLSPKSQVVV